ncbi:MAG TPA: ATPase, T2SS/T4P/T4SS family, partial [Paraburkholderia sp.]
MNAPASVLQTSALQTSVPEFDMAALDAMRSEARAAKQRLVDFFIARHGESGLPALGELLRMRAVDAHVLLGWTPALDVLHFEECLRRECIAARDASGALFAVITDPFDANLADWLGSCIQTPFRMVLTSRDALTAAHARVEESQQMVGGMQGGDAHGMSSNGAHEGEDISARRISEDDSPVVKLVNSTLYESLRQSASDIHIESVAGGLHIKYRIDGVLSRVGSVQGSEVAEQVISRIKVLAELDIAERRVPQDGRFKANANGREVDFRVSIMPSIFGEDAVLRVLDKQHLTEEMSGLTLASLGYDEATRAQIRRLANEPYGMLLVTGPTGSGKTTTLYATIGETNTGLEKIVTIEDPVEYQLPGVLQIPVNEKKGLTFARGL